MEKIDLDQNFEHMLISAVRYAIGRRTFIVKSTVDYILSLIPRLSFWCVNVMLADLSEEIKAAERMNRPEQLGDEIDRIQWDRLKNALETEIGRRKSEK